MTDDLQEAAAEKVEDAAEESKGFFDKVMDAAKDAVEKVGDVMENVAEKVGDVAETVADKAEDVYEAAKDKLGFGDDDAPAAASSDSPPSDGPAA
jgi:hypothetical protein